MPALAEDLALLLLDDTKGRSVVDVGRRHRAIGTAVLLELVRAEKVAIDIPADDAGAGRPVVRNLEPVGDPVLDAALAALGVKSIKLSRAAETIGADSWRPLLEQLVDRGLVREERGRALGLFPTRSWPATDTGYEGALVERLNRALVEGERPDEQIELLIMILHGIGAVATAFPNDDAAEVRERAARITEAGRTAGVWRDAFRGIDDIAYFTAPLLMS